MTNYCGVDNDDTVSKYGGAWIKEHNDGRDVGEIYNFQDYNHNCYGFVHIDGQIHIERFEKVRGSAEVVDNVLVVWCAKADDSENHVIVGWYKNATVYRYAQEIDAIPTIGRNLYYRVKAKADDTYLLPEVERTFVISRASVEGQGRGMGQSNLWYADSEYAKMEIVPKVVKYIEKYENGFINTIYDQDKLTKSLDCDESENILEKKASTVLENSISEEEVYQALCLINTAIKKKNCNDFMYSRGIILRELNCFDESIKVFEELLKREGDVQDILEAIVYQYAAVNENDKAIETAKKLMKFYEDATETICELYSIIIDAHSRNEEYELTIEYYNKIIELTSDENLREFTKQNKKAMLHFLENEKQM